MQVVNYKNAFVLTRVNKSDSKQCTICGVRLTTGDKAVIEMDVYMARAVICIGCVDADDSLNGMVIDECKNFELED